MQTKTHTVQLSKKECTKLNTIIRRGTHNARTVTRARILLLSHEGGGKNTIANTLAINRSTVRDVRNRYYEGGISRALYDAPRSGKPPKVDAGTEAHLVALACSDPPDGYERWTLALLQEQMRKDKKISLSTVSLWRHLVNRDIQPWREKNVVYPEDNQ